MLYTRSGQFGLCGLSVMTYFFHLFSDAEPVMDIEGLEYAALSDVIDHALAARATSSPKILGTA